MKIPKLEKSSRKTYKILLKESKIAMITPYLKHLMSKRNLN